MEENLSIERLITMVSQELISSQQKRIERGEPAIFELSEMVLDICFVATKSVGGHGGFDLKVVRADASGKYDQQQVHKVILKFKTGTTEESSLTLTPIRPRPDPS